MLSQFQPGGCSVAPPTTVDQVLAPPFPSTLSPPGYELLGELGRGGMGVVYRARQISLNRVVALKMILAGGHAGPELCARFLTEAETLAGLQHPHIVQIHDFGYPGGLPYMALEFMAGGSLAQKLAGRPQPAAASAALVEVLARAVHHAHQKGIVHRDLKPANVLLGRKADEPASPANPGWRLADFEPKITDFGLARLESSDLTAPGAIQGSPPYMAPEQAAGDNRSVGPATDVYALGAILYEMLTGRPPFQGSTSLETLELVRGQEPVPPMQLQPRTPRDLNTICLKCLHKEPGQRYATALALAEDLARFQAGRPVQARPVGPLERGWRWCRHNPLVAGLMAAVVVALLLGTVISGSFAVQSAHDAAEALSKRADAERETRRARQAEEQQRQAKKAAQQAQLAAQEAEKRKDVQLNRAEGLRYAGQLSAALREWEAGNVELAWDHLEACRWDLRGWEHNYLCTLFQNNQITLRGHTSRVIAVAFSPDGATVASGSTDDTVKLWDARTGQQRLSIPAGLKGLLAVAFSPDGTRLAGCGNSNTVAVWDPRTGRQLLSVQGHTERIFGIAWSPDGKRLAGGGAVGKPGPAVEVWDTQGGQELLSLQGENSWVWGVAFSPDGSRLAAGLKRMVKVWDARAGRELVSLPTPTDAIITSVAFSPDGSRLACCGVNLPPRVWDLPSGQELFSLRDELGQVTVVAFSPDGLRLCGSKWGGAPRVWDARTGQALFSLKGHSDNIHNVAFSPDGTRVVSGSADRTLKVWDVRGVPTDQIFRGHPNGVTCVAFSPDGTRFASAGLCPPRSGKDQAHNPYGIAALKGEVNVWEPKSGQILFSFEDHNNTITSLAFSPDGKRIASADKDWKVKVWDAQGGQALLSVRGDVSCLSFSPDGRRLAVALETRLRYRVPKIWDVATGRELLALDTTADVLAFSPKDNRLVTAGPASGLQVWDGATGRHLLALPGHSSPVTCLAFTRDGSRLVSGSADRTLKVWDVRTGREVASLQGHAGGVNCVAISPDGSRVASSSGDRTLKVWDARSGLELLSFSISVTRSGNRSPVFAMVTTLAFSPDGARLVSGRLDGTLQVWDAHDGQVVRSLRGHAAGSEVRSVAFSPDGWHLASTGNDGTVKVWDLHRGQDVLSFPVGGGVTAVAFSPDGRRVLGRSTNGKTLAWDLPSGEPLGEVDDPVPPATHEATSLDGQWRATAAGSRIQVVGVGEEAEVERRRQAWDRAALERLARFDPVWHRAQAATAEQAGEHFAASFHLGRLTYAFPWDAQLWLRQAHALARQERTAEASTSLLHALFLAPHLSPWPLDPHAATRAEAAVRTGAWAVAARAFQLAAHQPGASLALRRDLLLTQAAAGQADDCRQTLAELVSLLPHWKGPPGIDELFVACQAVSWGSSEARRLEEWTRHDLERRRDPRTLHRHGVALYRAGRTEQALTLLGEAAQAGGKGEQADTWLFQALALHKLGRGEEARRLLARGQDWGRRQTFPTWQARVGWELLLDEVRTAVAGPRRLPLPSSHRYQGGVSGGSGNESTELQT